MPTKQTPKPKLTTTRGRWEATLLNLRTLKARLAKLEARVQALENRQALPSLY